MLFNPQQTKKFLTSGTSPNKVLVSGVKDSGPEKNFLIPAVSKTGNLFNCRCLSMVQNVQNFLEIHQKKNLLELYLFYPKQE